MKIVSGKTGTPHVTSEQFRQIIEGTVGQGSYILTSGENLEPELASNNMLKIRGGMMSHHGNISCVDLNTYDEVTLTNGSQGVKRIDLIVNRYTRNDETGLEKNEWVVIIGTPDASNPKVPQHTIGNLQNGDLIDDCPVFEVHYDGINVTEVKKLLPVMSNLELLNGNMNRQDILWNGSPTYLDSGQSMKLSAPISEQKQGIIITVSRYDSGAQNYGWQSLFIPKEIIKENPNGGWTMPLVNASGTTTGNKYFYVNDNEIKGTDVNIQNNNKQWVFRYVIGV